MNKNIAFILTICSTALYYPIHSMDLVDTNQLNNELSLKGVQISQDFKIKEALISNAAVRTKDLRSKSPEEQFQGVLEDLTYLHGHMHDLAYCPDTAILDTGAKQDIFRRKKRIEILCNRFFTDDAAVKEKVEELRIKQALLFEAADEIRALSNKPEEEQLRYLQEYINYLSENMEELVDLHNDAKLETSEKQGLFGRERRLSGLCRRFSTSDPRVKEKIIDLQTEYFGAAETVLAIRASLS